MMLLLIFLFSILMSVKEIPKRLILNQFNIEQNISLTDQQISTIEEFDPLLLQVHPDAKLTTLELVRKYGYNGELHKVITFDGYILELHRITGRTNSSNSQVQKPVAFVMHGILCSSAAWVLVGPGKALAYVLADAGYDVWLGNARGTTYSRKHESLSILDKKYWDFSWHEIGIYDLPAMINYILKKTREKQLFYLGHSQGTTTFFVMMSELPQYQNKIKAMFAMAPIAYLGRMKSPIMLLLAKLSGSINALMKLIGQYEFKPTSEAMKRFQQLVCAEDAITQPICSNIIFLLAGFNKDLFNKTLLPIILGHLPAGASTKQMMHYTQLVNSSK